MARLLLERIQMLIPLLLSLSVHEWAHAWMAARLGDDTAEKQGRLTLNPLAHIDPIGTLALPLLGVPIGWAKPVPVNPSRFHREVSMGKGLLLTALAGPLANVALGAVCAAVYFVSDGAPAPLRSLLERAVMLNASLALLNLLPIPPLDGSRIVDGLIPFEWRARWQRLSMVSMVVLAVSMIALSVMGVLAPLRGQ